MAENLKQETVLVTAASGKTGRRVAERLAARGVDVRAGSRKGDVRFDWEDGSGWAPALAARTRRMSRTTRIWRLLARPR